MDNGKSAYEMESITTTLDPSSEEYGITRLKCKRCGNYYREIENTTTCYYHPGYFVDPEKASVLEATMVGWSCCRIKEYVGLTFGNTKTLPVNNEEALSASCKGCKTKPKHQEDKSFSKLISQFPMDPSFMKTASLAAQQTESVSPNSSPRTPINKNLEFYHHVIEDADTLVGISLKYGVSIASLQRVNRLHGHQIMALKELLIPLTESVTIPTKKAPDTKAEIMKEFKKKTKCEQEEAIYYMDLSGYNLEAALKEWEEDSSFEKSGKLKTSKNTSPVQFKHKKDDKLCCA